VTPEQPKSVPLTDAQIDSLFANLDETKLSEWEVKFVANTRSWWKQNRKLSDKQRSRLKELATKQQKPTMAMKRGTP
jgi:hypothetical protein